MRPGSNRSSFHGGNAATGLLFVGAVMLVLFGGGIGAVLLTESGGPQPAAAGAASRVSARVAADGTGGAADREAVVGRLAEVVTLRDAALSRRDVALLDRVYAPGSVNRRIDQASIAGLRRRHVRWLGLSHSVQAVEASRSGPRQWTVLATLACAPARLVTESGRPVKARPARRQLLRFTLVLPPGRGDWLLWRIAPATPAG